jgi:hypothetical protein
MTMKKFLKENGVALTLFVALLAAYGVGTNSVYNQITQQSATLHGKIDSVNTQLSGQLGKMESRTTKLESAVKALGDNQSDPLKGLVHDLLATALNTLSQKPELAAKAINVASSLIATLRKEKRPADAQYFESAVSSINELRAKVRRPELAKAVYSTGASLAEYRSALEPAPPIAGLTWLIATTDSENGVGYIGGPTHLNQVNFDFTFIGQREAIKVVPPLKGLLSENVVIENGYIKGGYNVLDGIHWSNVVFIGAHIIYRGGELELKNVRFVNCTFEVPDDDKGSQITNYASLETKELVIPG